MISGDGDIAFLKRALLSALQPMTGARAAGVATVRALAGDVVLPRNSYAVPIVESAAGVRQVHPARMVKTSAEATVTAAGVAVPVVSVLGGLSANLPLSTELVWIPPVAGVEVSSLLSTALTGGLEATRRGGLRRLLDFEGLGAAKSAEDVWRASGSGAFPCGVLSWEGAGEGEHMGVGRQRRAHRFRLYVIASRFDGALERQNEGEEAVSLAGAILCDRSSADGQVFSAPNIRLGASGRLAFAPTSLVYFHDFSVQHTTRRLDDRTYPDWTAVNLLLHTVAEADDNPALVPTPHPLSDIQIDMNTEDAIP